MVRATEGEHAAEAHAGRGGGVAAGAIRRVGVHVADARDLRLQGVLPLRRCAAASLCRCASVSLRLDASASRRPATSHATLLVLTSARPHALQLSEHISSIAEDTREETVYQIRVRTDASRKDMREMQAQIDRLDSMIGSVCAHHGIQVPPPVDPASINHSRGRTRTGVRRSNQRSKGLTKEASCSRFVRDTAATRLHVGFAERSTRAQILPTSPDLPPPAYEA